MTDPELFTDQIQIVFLLIYQADNSYICASSWQTIRSRIYMLYNGIYSMNSIYKVWHWMTYNEQYNTQRNFKKVDVKVKEWVGAFFFFVKFLVFVRYIKFIYYDYFLMWFLEFYVILGILVTFLHFFVTDCKTKFSCIWEKRY